MSTSSPITEALMVELLDNVKNQHQEAISNLKSMIVSQEMRIIQLETKGKSFENLMTKMMLVEEEMKNFVKKIDSFEQTISEMKDNIVDSEFISFTSEMVATKIDSFQPMLNSIFTGQIEFLKRMEKNKKLYEEMKAAVAGLKEFSGKGTENGRLSEIEKTTAQSMEKELEEFLTGDLSWAKTRIFIENGKIITDEGKTVSLARFKEELVNTPWTIFPEKYETILWATKHFDLKFTVSNGQITTEKGKKISVHQFVKTVKTRPYDLFPELYNIKCRNYSCPAKISCSNIREDNVSVACPRCTWPTVMGPPEKGYEWIIINSCKHYLQMAIGQRPEACEVCGNPASDIRAPANSDAQVPFQATTNKF